MSSQNLTTLQSSINTIPASQTDSSILSAQSAEKSAIKYNKDGSIAKKRGPKPKPK